MPDDDDTILTTITDQDGRDIEIRRYDVLQVFGTSEMGWPREWRDVRTITTTAGAADAARQVLTHRAIFGQPWRIVRDGIVILK